MFTAALQSFRRWKAKITEKGDKEMRNIRKELITLLNRRQTPEEHRREINKED